MMKLHQNDSTKDWILLSKDGKQRIEVHSPVILDKWTSPVSAHLYFNRLDLHASSNFFSCLRLLTIATLITLANSLDLDGLLNEIFDFLVERISPESSIRLWQLCKEYNIEKHIEKFSTICSTTWLPIFRTACVLTGFSFLLKK
uniref:BTB domain-containing protein n=1 Tax=Ditylenchus dipsaci TaxID=166011 RepID=A0A915ERQ1_9BILA